MKGTIDANGVNRRASLTVGTRSLAALPFVWAPCPFTARRGSILVYISSSSLLLMYNSVRLGWSFSDVSWLRCIMCGTQAALNHPCDTMWHRPDCECPNIVLDATELRAGFFQRFRKVSVQVRSGWRTYTRFGRVRVVKRAFRHHEAHSTVGGEVAEKTALASALWRSGPPALCPNPARHKLHSTKFPTSDHGD